MSESDLDEVVAIENDSFPHPWTKAHFLSELEGDHSFPLIALGVENHIIGYICPMIILDEGHILDIAVHKNYRGNGIGKMLVERVLLDLSNRGAAFVSLEVRLSNKSAINLYKRLGFIETGRRKAYYENGEDALLMEYIY